MHIAKRSFFLIDEDDESPAFFDSEELFQQLNYECVDGVTVSEEDEDKVIVVDFWSVSTLRYIKPFLVKNVMY
jgi:hypothetical protein